MDSCRLKELAAVHASTLIALMLRCARQLISRTIYAAVAMPICLSSIASSPIQSASTQVSRLNQRIGVAAPRRYAKVRDAKDWNNPYVVIRADGIEVISKQLPSGRKLISAADMEQTLLVLPAASWPYGRVVALQENAVKAPNPNQDASIAANLKWAIAILKKLDVVVERWPGP